MINNVSPPHSVPQLTLRIILKKFAQSLKILKLTTLILPNNKCISFKIVNKFCSSGSLLVIYVT